MEEDSCYEWKEHVFIQYLSVVSSSLSTIEGLWFLSGGEQPLIVQLKTSLMKTHHELLRDFKFQLSIECSVVEPTWGPVLAP